MRHAILLILTLVACFGVQALALRAVGGRTTKSESNYFSSLGRIQAGTTDKAEIMLLGSSITGRLPDRANGFDGMANMGCDGGSAVDALRAMDRGLLPTAPVLVIETNTLHQALNPMPSEVGLAMEKPWFQAGMRLPAISSYARPAGFFYSALLARKIGDFGDSVNGPDLELQSRPKPVELPYGNDKIQAEHALADEIVILLKNLRARDCRTILVWLPPGRKPGSPVPEWIARIVSESGSEWWDLGTEADPKLIELTDGVHMAAHSAARTVRSLKKAIQP
jgi:hypothetical protein